MKRLEQNRPERVAGELARFLRPETCPDRDPEVGWPAVLDLASHHQLLPALWSSLRATGVRPLPERLRLDRASPLAILEHAYEQNVLRVIDLRSQTIAVLDTLGVAGIDALPLKGTHWLLAEWLPDPAARVMIDVDVLVPRDLAAEALDALLPRGYEAVASDDRFEGFGDHQLIPLRAPGRAGSVELHLAPLVNYHRRLLDATELWRDAVEVHVAHASRLLPSPTHAAVLLMGHAQLQDETARLLQLPLRALADVTALVALGVDIDWDAVSHHFQRARASYALAGFAVAAADLFDTQLPVSRSGGRAWLDAVWWAARNPRIAHRYREAVSLPRALRTERMRRLYHADTASDLARARLAHVLRGVARRLEPHPPVSETRG